MDEWLDEANPPVNVKEPERTRLLIRKILQEEPNDWRAWLLLSELAPTDRERRLYLRQAERIHSEQEVARRQAKDPSWAAAKTAAVTSAGRLTQTPSRSSQTMAPTIQPELKRPTPGPSARPARARTIWRPSRGAVAVAVAAAILLAMVAIALALARPWQRDLTLAPTAAAVTAPQPTLPASTTGAHPESPVEESSIEGSSLILGDGAAVTLPAGVQLTVSDITFAKLGDPPPLPSPDEAIPVSAIYDVGPDGMVFDTPVEITLPYDPGSLPTGVSAYDLMAAYWDGSAWIVDDSVVTVEVDEAAHTFRFQILHFTPVGGFYEVAASTGEAEAAYEEIVQQYRDARLKAFPMSEAAAVESLTSPQESAAVQSAFEAVSDRLEAFQSRYPDSVWAKRSHYLLGEAYAYQWVAATQPGDSEEEYLTELRDLYEKALIEWDRFAEDPPPACGGLWVATDRCPTMGRLESSLAQFAPNGTAVYWYLQRMGFFDGTGYAGPQGGKPTHLPVMMTTRPRYRGPDFRTYWKVGDPAAGPMSLSQLPAPIRAKAEESLEAFGIDGPVEEHASAARILFSSDQVCTEMRLWDAYHYVRAFKEIWSWTHMNFAEAAFKLFEAPILYTLEQAMNDEGYMPFRFDLWSNDIAYEQGGWLCGKEPPAYVIWVNLLGSTRENTADVYHWQWWYLRTPDVATLNKEASKGEAALNQFLDGRWELYWEEPILYKAARVQVDEADPVSYVPDEAVSIAIPVRYFVWTYSLQGSGSEYATLVTKLFLADDPETPLQTWDDTLRVTATFDSLDLSASAPSPAEQLSMKRQELAPKAIIPDGAELLFVEVSLYMGDPVPGKEPRYVAWGDVVVEPLPTVLDAVTVANAKALAPLRITSQSRFLAGSDDIDNNTMVFEVDRRGSVHISLDYGGGLQEWFWVDNKLYAGDGFISEIHGLSPGQEVQDPASIAGFEHPWQVFVPDRDKDAGWFTPYFPLHSVLWGAGLADISVVGTETVDGRLTDKVEIVVEPRIVPESSGYGQYVAHMLWEEWESIVNRKALCWVDTSLRAFMKARWDVAFADGTQELYSLEVEQVDIPTIIPPTPEAKAVEIDIWVEGGEGATYYDGDELILCYEVSRPVDVRIYQCPSGQACAIFTQVGNSDGGRCFQEHLDLPIGVTTYRVEASDDGEIAAEAETYIYVDQPPQPTGESPDESLIIYYNLVSDGRYEEAWARLSPSFQENMHSDGFASYVEYYEDLGAWGVWVEDVQIVEQDGHDAVVAAVLVFDWGSTSTVKHYKIDYHMVYDSSRELWLIDRTVRK